ncbi:MAG: carboxypeptidase-like regulatory domain-containing protein [Candidatus Sericytochromatia bacterium]
MKLNLLIACTLLFSCNNSNNNNPPKIERKSFCFNKESFNIKTTPTYYFLSGNIIDKQTLETIDEAKINFMDKETKSDKNGNFSIMLFSFEYCTYLIKVSKNGYKDYTKEIIIDKDFKGTNLKIELEKL